MKLCENGLKGEWSPHRVNALKGIGFWDYRIYSGCSAFDLNVNPKTLEAGGAAFGGPDKSYRYALSRVWGEGDRLLVFLMLNPSTADAFKLDPTVTRCKARAQSEGYDGLIVLNLFAFRATDPKDMKRSEEPVGCLNDRAIEYLAFNRTVICAWGNHGAYQGRSARVLARLQKPRVSAPRLFCLAKNKSGEPMHPLYCPNDAPLLPFP